jgi:hypothetical protein
MKIASYIACESYLAVDGCFRQRLRLMRVRDENGAWASAALMRHIEPNRIVAVDRAYPAGQEVTLAL